MYKPLVSIVIPVYNVEAYLRECLDSIVLQLFEDYEVILVDDGSPDGSPVICDDYASRYSQIHVIHKDNGGVSSARNVGLDIANGEWVWFVDADDWVTKDSLIKLSKAILDYDFDIIYFGLDQVGNGIVRHEHSQDVIDTPKDVFLQKVQCNTHQAILYRADIIRSNRILFPIGMKMSEDLEFQYKYLLHCNKPIMIPDTLYYLRVREGSASHNPQTTRNSVYGNQMILKHMLEYIQHQEDKGLAWMGQRMVLRVKNLIKAAGRFPVVKHSDIQEQVRFYIEEFRKIGYPEFNSKTMKLAYYDTRLYYIFYRIIRYINSKR